MDHFGIGAALLGSGNIYLRAARQTGRTTSLLNSLKDGDRVIVPTERQQRRWQSLLAERQLKVEVRWFSVDRLHDLYHLGTGDRQTRFEHTWVEEFYIRNLEDSIRHLDELQQRLSGWGEAHERTRRQAQELARWEIHWEAPRPIKPNN